jgi:AraC-like DNA-binding protein
LQLVPRAASPRLRGVVRDYWGYSERTGNPLRRRELPTADIIFIVNLGEPLRVEQPRSEARVIPPGEGFVAGLHETYAVTATAGSQAGIELRLSPLGAYRLVGQPMASLVNRSAGLDELFGRWATGLSEQVQNAPDWESRFAALDAALAPRLGSGPAPAPEIVWVWRQLAASGGRVSIATLADELGWSPKRLIARCREQIGLPPKQIARLLRFQRATNLLAATTTPDWGAIARHCGYYDQAHLINEFQRFAGETPQGLARRRLATGGFAAD